MENIRGKIAIDKRHNVEINCLSIESLSVLFNEPGSGVLVGVGVPVGGMEWAVTVCTIASAVLAISVAVASRDCAVASPVIGMVTISSLQAARSMNENIMIDKI